MTIEEAIQLNEEKGEKYKVLSLAHEPYLIQDAHQYSRCSNEYFQIAEWLKELKRLREERAVAPDINVGTMVYRQAAIDALCSVCGVDCDKSKFVYDGKQEDQVILCPEHYALTQLPSAQPERKTGKWLPDNRPGGGFWVCSCCKFPSEAFAADKLYKYCPVCGCRMEEGDQDD